MRENVKKGGTFLNFSYTTIHNFSLFFCFKKRGIPPKQGQLAGMQVDGGGAAHTISFFILAKYHVNKLIQCWFVIC